MAHITMEYMIMLPVLIMQIFLFPLTANWLMNIWVDSRQTLALQDVAGHLGSTIQQLYSSLNHESISTGTAAYSPNLPPFIEGHPYRGTAVLHAVSEPAINSTRILELTVTMTTTGNTVTVSVVLGSNASWQDSTFISNSTYANLNAEKFTNGTICLYFNG